MIYGTSAKYDCSAASNAVFSGRRSIAIDIISDTLAVSLFVIRLTVPIE